MTNCEAKQRAVVIVDKIVTAGEAFVEQARAEANSRRESQHTRLLAVEKLLEAEKVFQAAGRELEHLFLSVGSPNGSPSNGDDHEWRVFWRDGLQTRNNRNERN